VTLGRPDHKKPLAWRGGWTDLGAVNDPAHGTEFREIVAESKACQERFLAEVGRI